MQPIVDKETALGRAARFLGTAMMLAWTFVIGILGFVLLLGVYYAMVAQSQSLLTVCCFLLFSPLLLTVVFGCLSLAERMVQRFTRRRRSFQSPQLVRATSGADA